MLIGQVDVEVVSDGVALLDGGAAFGLVPRVLWEQVVQPDESNRIPMAVRCLLVRTAGKIILVDTGYGDELTSKERDRIGLWGERRLLSDLKRLAIGPDDVDIVINSHLHGDHCGGNTMLRDGLRVPAYSNAEYWTQRRELADARYPNERTQATYSLRNFVPLEAAGQLRVVDGDAQVTPEVRCWVTRGHTRSLQVVVIESDGEAAIYLSDACGWAVSLERLAWVPAYDVEPMESIETKRQIRDWALRTGALLIFQQDVGIVAGRMRADSSRPGQFRVERVDTGWS